MNNNSFAVPKMDEGTACALISGFSGKRVLVAGDVMLDEYLIGEVKRISPEAPVPVVDITHRAHVPGGAANVAANIARLGGEPILVGIVGEDEGAVFLRTQLELLGVSANSLVAVKNRPTITKTRIVSGQQQIARLDREPKSPVEDDVIEKILQVFTEAFATADACILSDYAKGLLTPRVCKHCVALSRQQSKPLVVDPKGGDFRKYAGCTVITPNMKEAETASGLTHDANSDLHRISEKISETLGLQSAVLITRGADGMTLFVPQDPPLHVPALAHEVFDVTGAGDTVGGTLTLSLAAGASLPQAMLLSNLAASVVVQKSGTATVSDDELTGACRDYSASAPSPVSDRAKERSYSSISTRTRLER